MPKNISERILTQLDKAAEKTLTMLLKDISDREDIDYKELESEFLNKKKKQNGYTKYSSKRRKELIEQNPDKKFGDLSKIIGDEWSKLTDKEKLNYNKEK